MKKLLFTLFFILLFVGQANALISNPLPGTFGADDHSEIFDPCLCLTTIEGYDFKDQTTGSTFGFFFTNDPGTLITIFDPLDKKVGTTKPSAKIDFVNGIVYDKDDNWSIQDTFTINAASIGFFLKPNSVHTLYTVASMNNNGLDVAATFPHLTLDKTYLFGFENPYTNAIFAFEVVKGITPVPEPETAALMGLGLLFLASILVLCRLNIPGISPRHNK